MDAKYKHIQVGYAICENGIVYLWECCTLWLFCKLILTEFHLVVYIDKHQRVIDCQLITTNNENELPLS